MQRGDLRHRTARPGGVGCPACTGGTPSTRAGRRRGHRRCACRAGGSALCSPLAVVRKWAMPMSIPVTASVAGSGSAGTSSQARMTYHCLPSRVTLIVLTRPLTGRCWCTRTCPTPCRRTRVTGSCGVESQRQPSPSWGNSGRVEPVHATEPGIARLLTGLDPPEERGERLAEAPQRGLLAGERPAALALRVERPDLLKLRRLVPVADARFRPMPVRVPAFPQRPVIERAVIHKRLRHRLRLLGRRAEEELTRAAHSAPPSPPSPKDVPTGCRCNAPPYPHSPRRPMPRTTTKATACAYGNAAAGTPPAAPATCSP